MRSVLGSARGRRRSAVAAVVATIGVAASLILLAGGDSRAAVPRQDESAAPAPARSNEHHPRSIERLVPDLAMMSNGPADQRPTQIPFVEIFADGAVRDVPVDLPEHTAVDSIRPLPDGRVAVYVTQDLMPGVAREDGPNVEGLARAVLLVDASGSVVSRHDFDTPETSAMLLSATRTDAIVQYVTSRPDAKRPATSRIVSRRFSDGRERTLMTLAEPAASGDVAGTQVVAAGGGISFDRSQPSTKCWVRWGERRAGRPAGVRLPRCQQIVGVDVAPDARTAAIVYSILDGTPQARVALINLDRARVTHDRRISIPIACDRCQFPAVGGYLGMAWTDHTTLRVARMKALPFTLSRARVISEMQRRMLLTSVHVDAP